MRSLYFSLVNPYYEYGNIVWAVKNTVSLQKLFLTQKKAIRIITNSEWQAHTYSLFHKLSVLKIEELHKLQVACFMFKFHNGLMPSYFIIFIHKNADVHNYNTRHARDYHITMHRTSLIKHTCTLHIAGPSLWNSLDCNIKVPFSICSFRNRMKKALLLNLV